jgi:hypothetical protein
VPPDSVRCTRVDQLQLATFGFLEIPLRYNSPDRPVYHRTVQCASGATATAQRSTPTETCKSATVRGQSAQSQSRRQKVHRTVRWSHLSQLQRSNPNGWVTWLAHRTVSGGAPDCPVRPSTAALPNGCFGGWGYKYPQPPPFKASKFSAVAFNTRALDFTPRHKQKIKSSPKSKIIPNN